jgi:hypothetical protein
MVGYTPPNRYQPRANWRAKLDSWAQSGTPNAGSWQADITLYWRWTTLEGSSLMEAWTRLRMQPVNARSSLDPNSTDRGLIPPELFSRVLARSRAKAIDPNDNVADVIIEDPPKARQAGLARKKRAKRKTSKRKSAKSAKRKSVKRKSTTRQAGQRRRKK